jgi:hypothetical protein
LDSTGERRWKLERGQRKEFRESDLFRGGHQPKYT